MANDDGDSEPPQVRISVTVTGHLRILTGAFKIETRVE